MIRTASPTPALLAFLLAVATPHPARAQEPATPLVVGVEWLATRISDPSVVILHVEHGDYAEGHIPGSRALPYDSIVTRRGTLGSELPEAELLRARFARLGVSDASHVIVYAHEGPMATRAILTLTFLGQAKVSLLDGGLEAWRAAGHAVVKNAPAPRPGVMSARPAPAIIADAAWIQERLGKPGLSLIDTRTDGEYNGTGNRSGMPSVGHLAGARQLPWEEVFEPGSTKLKPRTELAKLFADRVTPGDTVVTYCWVGYRASATWFAARFLGYDVRLYDGSYQDWSQRQLPTKAGTAPE